MLRYIRGWMRSQMVKHVWIEIEGDRRICTICSAVQVCEENIFAGGREPWSTLLSGDVNLHYRDRK